MSVIIKRLLLTLTVAVFGVTAHHVTNDTSVADSIVSASILPDVDRNHSSSIAPNKDRPASSQSATDHFQHLNDHLKDACAAAQAMPGYTAILEMQEEVDGKLRPVDRIEFKTRREPFSVYMRWQDSEQEALYVDGSNDNRLVVKPTKGLAAIRRVWRLEPNCRMAKRNCRYPITDAGIENLAVRVQEFYSQGDNWSALAECECSDATFASRKVTVFEVKFKDEKSSPEYCASKFCFDKDSQLLIAAVNFGWSDGQEPRLIERYVYSEIKELTQPVDDDFSEANPAYQFVAR